jgi:hypothetical protein
MKKSILFSPPYSSSRSPRLRLASAGPRTLAPRFHAARAEFISNLRQVECRLASLRPPFPRIRRRVQDGSDGYRREVQGGCVPPQM